MANTAGSSSLSQKQIGASIEVRLPASTSNLGAGFDCFGLALKLYLTIRATVMPLLKVKCRVRSLGSRESAALPRTAENIIYRAMAYAASREDFDLPPLSLAVHNLIPIGRGLGSSAAAICGGIKLSGLITGHELSNDRVLQYAMEFEGHPDNVSASLLGGFVVTCVTDDGRVIALKKDWPPALKVLVISPRFQVETKVARATLPRTVNRSDAVHNLQRSALFTGALAEKRFDLLSEAMKDRLHQQRRQSLVPGLADALNIRPTPGLIGLALSGAGPSIVALAVDHFAEVGEVIANCYRKHRLQTTIRQLDVDTQGCQTRVIRNERTSRKRGQ